MDNGFGVGLPEATIIFVVVCFMILMVVINVIPFWFISKKAGYHPALGLLTLVPLVNLIYLYFLAFADWPALQRTPPRQF